MTAGGNLEQRIRNSLAVLAPTRLELRDDSAAHAGHAGAGSGSHYELTIVSERFAGVSRVARHRMVYAALGPLMQAGIHALALATYAPSEDIAQRD